MKSPRNKLPSLGVDIGSGIVKLAAVEQTGARIDIAAAGSFGLDSDAVVNGIVADPRRFGKALKSKLSSLGVGVCKAVVSVPSSLAVIRWLQLPNLEGDELREAARYKVKRHLPFSVSEAYIEATPPALTEAEGTGQSIVIAVPRPVIDSRAEALEHACQIPVSAELEAQAILRIVDRQMMEKGVLWRDASMTIIDVGANNTHMYVVQSQRLQFIRGVKFGSLRIAAAVGRELGVNEATADLLVGQPDTELWTEGVLRVRHKDAIHFIYVQEELDRLTREFLRLFRYFRSLHPERSYAGILDHVVICGGLASLTGFAEYLEQVLELRVDRSRPLAGMVAKLDRESFENVSNRQEAYAVVMGLAISGLSGQISEEGVTHARREFSWTRAA